ncbi:type II toxin-antitoxin system antitoxin SocA domain-containing protein [Helicobacter sp. 13S00477-4]|uniref:Panacea domain-containing protein n=1 Tax=Helicobacter sp. 13S00477-4 TaxID=1905759 RepID=UPI000BA65F87|nr:type II toxin-antitoxin system antitoxin SocA domain-containing protein [Helicobacter sp. 13S00477-4]PAF52001.1 hypothetical protein BKH44_04905 [Helicobacter sp. 13S00477-4]
MFYKKLINYKKIIKKIRTQLNLIGSKVELLNFEFICKDRFDRVITEQKFKYLEPLLADFTKLYTPDAIELILHYSSQTLKSDIAHDAQIKIKFKNSQPNFLIKAFKKLFISFAKDIHQEADIKALDLARYIIYKCDELDYKISNLVLLKFLYFVHIGFLKQTGKRLITDKDFQAYQWGPVIREVYYNYSIFGSNPLNGLVEIKQDLPLNEHYKRIIDSIIKESIKLRPWELVQKSHQSKAWQKIYDEGRGDKEEIPFYLFQKEVENEK